MNDFVLPATALVVKMDSDESGTVSFELMAIDDSGEPILKVSVGPSGSTFQFSRGFYSGSSDIDAAFLNVLQGQFSGGQLRRVIASNMYATLRYIETHHAPVWEQIRTAQKFDIDTVSMFGPGVPVYIDAHGSELPDVNASKEAPFGFKLTGYTLEEMRGVYMNYKWEHGERE